MFKIETCSRAANLETENVPVVDDQTNGVARGHPMSR